MCAVLSRISVGLLLFAFMGASSTESPNPPLLKTQLGIKGRPFQARYVSSHSERLPDGKIEQDEQTGAIYRANDGHERREFLSFGPDSEILIFDPNKVEIITLHPASKSASRLMLNVESGSPAFVFWPWACRVAGPAGDLLPEVGGIEYIGNKEIEKLMCRGFRKVDNSSGSVTEFWHAEELMGPLFVKTVSKQDEYTWKLINLSLAEPDSQLFVVSKDYKILTYRDP